MAAAMTQVVALYHVPPSQVWERSGGRARGNVHLHVTEDATLGRLKRSAGECLCSKRRGSSERPLDASEFHSTFRCERCYAVAARYGIKLPTSLGIAA
jgi:hypothetical protein